MRAFNDLGTGSSLTLEFDEDDKDDDDLPVVTTLRRGKSRQKNKTLSVTV
jgi:hypothetical protein